MNIPIPDILISFNTASCGALLSPNFTVPSCPSHNLKLSRLLKPIPSVSVITICTSPKSGKCAIIIDESFQ